jgi:hypothetical protein
VDLLVAFRSRPTVSLDNQQSLAPLYIYTNPKLTIVERNYNDQLLMPCLYARYFNFYFRICFYNQNIATCRSSLCKTNIVANIIHIQNNFPRLPFFVEE